MSSESVAHAPNLASQVFSALFLEAETFQVFDVFQVNPSPDYMDEVEPLRGARWTEQFIALQCGAGDQTFVYNPTGGTLWSQQTDLFRDHMSPGKVVEFMTKYCGPRSNTPIS